MSTFSWLHFSDLHEGQKGAEELWSPIEKKLKQDLRRLHAKMDCASHGGWDAVFFTGDLAFKGDPAEYEKLNDKLENLWTFFQGELGCDPALIAIPGNHDAAQSASAAATNLITVGPGEESFWNEENQKAVTDAFAAYVAWYADWRKRHAGPYSRLASFRPKGLVPGDVSAIFERDGARIGVVGFNSAFVDLGKKLPKGVQRNGSLVVDPKQRYAIWPAEDERSAHTAIVLTHHPRGWLRKEIRFAANVAPSSEFLLHCFGHMHEANQTKISYSGGEPTRLSQGASLFGMEKIESDEGSDDVQRLHGYGGGAIDWGGASAFPRLRIWPRFARVLEGGEWYLFPDHMNFVLDQDDAVTEQLLDYRTRLPRPLDKERQLAAGLLRAALRTGVDPDPADQANVEPLLAPLVTRARVAAPGELARLARLAVEHYLLDPDAEGLESLERYAKTASLSEKVDVDPKFFDRVQQREAAWTAYFRLLESEGVPREEIRTSCVVGGTAFIAPQHLLAGLLARMDDEWQKVLDVYDRVAEDRKNALGKPPEEGASAAFDRLQAAQWICWLIWGPSIPACTCYAWEGARALQLGYGDENFSLPVFDASPARGLLDQLSSGLKETRVGAVPVTFTGRLTWAPLLCGDVEAKKMSKRTQKSLFDRDDGSIAMLLESAEKTDKANRSYFTSYQWMMFLVGKKPKKEGGPPRLLGNANYPVFPPETKMDRADVRGERLWRNVIPVFVHANLADAEVFERQRAMLVDNAVALLHSIWLERAELFDEADTSDGIRFFLVAASDHTGCGWRPQFPSAVPLAAVLKERLEREKDRAFADVVSVPAFPAGDEAWKRLAGHFSTCGMPLMVSNYYAYVKDVKGHKLPDQ